MMRHMMLLGLVAAVGLWAAGAAEGKLIYDVTLPANTVTAVNGQDDGDGEVADGGGNNPPLAEGAEKSIDNVQTAKYLNFLDVNSGFTVTLSAAKEVRGIGLTTANDAPGRDPMSATIIASNDGTTWVPIVTNLATALSTVRYAEAEFTFTPITSGTFLMYQVIFPTVRGGDNSMQIGEVRLVGEDGTAPPVAGPDVTRRGNAVWGTSMHYPGGDRSGGETPAMAIDNDPATKYLNFDKENSGLTVMLNAAAAINGIGLTTANDSAARDPASVTIRGSNDGTSWSDIVIDLLTPLPDARFAEAVFAFTPVTSGAFSMYQVIFPTLKNSASANSMQIGEIRLLPEPATLALLGLGALGVVARRRRG